jgi:predicted amidohydrolase YtcJ
LNIFYIKWRKDMDLILINGNVHTMDVSQPHAEAVAIKDGIIQKVGNNEEILKYKDENTMVENLRGRLVIPGFNDSHMHLYSFGESLGMVDLSTAASIEDVILRVKKFITENKLAKGTWVRGRGWNQDYFTRENRFPNRWDLDIISTEHPIVLARACGHVASVNSRALEDAGITRETIQPVGGCFDVDYQGEPLGILRENALSLIYDIIPEKNLEEIKQTIRRAAEYANKKGITSVQTDDLEHIPGKDFRKMIKAYTELEKEGLLSIRVYEQCLLSDIHRLKQFLGEGFKTGLGDSIFRIGPLKILADGSLGARTAALNEPYDDDPGNCGISIYTQEELDELVNTAHQNGMHVAVHCIGDKTMYMAFEAIEKALGEKLVEDHRHSIVHCQITDETLLEKYKQLEVVAHIQPIFLHYDLHMVEDRIGFQRTQKTYAFKTMLDKGIKVALGTDCPVEALDPLPNIYCAVTRKDLKGYPEQGWRPEERLSVEEAVYCYTMGGAHASFEEKEKGSITEGKLADLVILNEDIFNIEPECIKDVNVEMTIFNGRIIYRTVEK